MHTQEHVAIVALAKVLAQTAVDLQDMRNQFRLADKDAEEWKARYWAAQSCPTCDRRINTEDRRQS